MTEERLSMEDCQPVFIVGFQRGGTGILQNLILSHPDFCTTGGELHQVFHGFRRIMPIEPWGRYLSRWINYLPVMIRQGEDVFSRRRWSGPRPLQPESRLRIHSVLESSKRRAVGETQNRYKSDGCLYQPTEIEDARFVTKCLNGLIFATDELIKMYPKARFVGIVRDGRAICEGHIRRGAAPQTVAAQVALGLDKMIKDEASFPEYMILRFEDILENPLAVVERLYAHLGVSLETVAKLRVVPMPVMTKAGERHVPDGFEKQRLKWLAPGELADYLDHDVNANQMQQVDEATMSLLQPVLQESLQHFGYA